MGAGSCCAAGEATWLLGGVTSIYTNDPPDLYSWGRAGQPWQPHRPCPGHLWTNGSLVFDGHHSLWAIARKESGVWRFNMPSDQWSTMKSQPRSKEAPGSLFGWKFIVQAGGEEKDKRDGTSSIRLLHVTTGHFIDSPSTLHHFDCLQFAVSISRTN